MTKNPLTTVVILFVLGDAFTIKELFAGRPLDAFIALALIQCVVLLYLYLRKSPFAGSFLFLSSLIFFPAYFGLKAIGLNPPPTTGTVYVIAFVIYAVSITIVWRKKKEYEHYLSATQQPALSRR